MMVHYQQIIQIIFRVNSSSFCQGLSVSSVRMSGSVWLVCSLMHVLQFNTSLFSWVTLCRACSLHFTMPWCWSLCSLAWRHNFLRLKEWSLVPFNRRPPCIERKACSAQYSISVSSHALNILTHPPDTGAHTVRFEISSQIIHVGSIHWVDVCAVHELFVCARYCCLQQRTWQCLLSIDIGITRDVGGCVGIFHESHPEMLDLWG